MKLQWFKLFVAAFALAFTGTMSAAVVIDQDNTQSSDGIMSSFLNGSQLQSFQQSASNIVGAGILLEGSGTDSITINLYDLLPLPESGAMLLATGSAVGTGGSWVDVYWGEMSISPDTTYYLEFSGSILATAADLDNQYSRGIYYSRTFTGHPAYDLVFRTYANDTVVPEPGTYLMFLAGMGMIGAITRRRKLSGISPAA